MRQPPHIVLSITLALLLTLIAVKVHAVTAPPAAIRDKWALIVGISHFQDATIKPLVFGANSAQDLSNVLRDTRFGKFAEGHVHLLTNEHATRYGIEVAGVDGWLLRKALPNDLVIVYLCTRIVEDPASGSYYLCAADSIGTEIGTTGIQLDSFLSNLKRRIQSKHIICLLDTTPMNETATDKNNIARGKLAESIKELVRRTGVSIFSASELGQKSYEASTSLESCFAHFLVEGIKSTQGTAPLKMVSQYVAQSVEEECSRAQGKQQRPLLVFPEDNETLATVPLGVQIKSNRPIDSLNFGHPVNSLALDRPDLDGKINSHLNEAAGVQEDNDPPATFSQADFTAYLSRIKESIQKKWQPPQGFEDRTVATLFTINRDGTIGDESIVESSGNENVDNAALAALKAASPVDPLPPGSPRAVQIRYKFKWHVSQTK